MNIRDIILICFITCVTSYFVGYKQGQTYQLQLQKEQEKWEEKRKQENPSITEMEEYLEYKGKQ